VTLFSAVRIAPKDSTSGEATYQPALGELVSSLKAWLQTSKVSTVKTSEMTGGLYTRSGLPLAAPVGTICLQQAEDCRRTTDDTDAYRSKPIGTLRETALVVGIDSTQTGNAHYLSLGVTRGDVLEGVYALSQTNPQAAGFDRGTLRGSASDFVTDLLSRKLIAPPSAELAAALPKLYVAIITRDCPAMAAAFFCAKDYVVQLDPAALPEDVNVVLTARAYIHPGDTNGANPRFLLSPVVIK
jgi:hypothetical protein